MQKSWKCRKSESPEKSGQPLHKGCHLGALCPNLLVQRNENLVVEVSVQVRVRHAVDCEKEKVTSADLIHSSRKPPQSPEKPRCSKGKPGNGSKKNPPLMKKNCFHAKEVNTPKKSAAPKHSSLKPKSPDFYNCCPKMSRKDKKGHDKKSEHGLRTVSAASASKKNQTVSSALLSSIRTFAFHTV